MGGEWVVFGVFRSCVENWLWKIIINLDGCYFNWFLVVWCNWCCWDRFWEDSCICVVFVDLYFEVFENDSRGWGGGFLCSDYGFNLWVCVVNCIWDR